MLHIGKRILLAVINIIIVDIAIVGKVYDKDLSNASNTESEYVSMLP